MRLVNIRTNLGITLLVLATWGCSGEAGTFGDSGGPATDSSSTQRDGSPSPDSFVPRYDIDYGDAGKSWPTCATAKGEAIASGGSVDIIWFIDTSGSMNEETRWVQDNLNDFATFIGKQNIDYRVVMIGTASLCVKPPLGGPGCSDGPRYRHVKQTVSSTDGLEKTISTYPKWQDFLRPEATKNFIAVTDDNSRKAAGWFMNELKKLKNPGFPNGLIYHSIVAFGPDPRRGCSTGARIGSVYLELTQATKGIKFPVCDKDWKSIFDQLAKGVAQTAKVPCSYTIPDPPAGKTFNPSLIVVWRKDLGNEGKIPKVPNKAACGKGWYYDDPVAPKKVILCPQTCSEVAEGKIEIEFGCLGGIN